MGNRQEIINLYENTLKLNPTNEKIMISLYNAYAREYNYMKAQQIALKLYKLSGSIIYH